MTQATRGWDEDKQKTFAQRTKETADDYRYFPDPDLPKLKISEIPEFADEKLKESLPELPAEARERLIDLGVDKEDVETLLERRDLKELFDASVERLEDDEEYTLAVNYLTSDVVGLEREHDETQNLSAENFAKLITMISQDDLSSRGGKDTLKIMFTEGGDPQKIAEENELLQKSGEDELAPVVDEIIEENPDVVEEYKGGKDSAIQYLIGQGMQKTGGSANPQVLRKLLAEKMEE